MLHAPEGKPGQGETAQFAPEPVLRHLRQGRDEWEDVCRSVGVLCRPDQVPQRSLCVVTEEQLTERDEGISHSERVAGFG
ncbi:hypothetical protein GCM10008937_03580 [Deinococcus depolymerans]|uniref:Uncharacterized protein n=1 Tax=Deinococcus depolymerans TaxID=392408 RepID=A0ABN1BJY4_9DEIO